MEPSIMQSGRRAGWSDAEAKLLWETADEAQQQGFPLKSVFERVANQTGRRPNSIRNYYYAQVQKHAGGEARTARFVPFTEPEVRDLMEKVLRERAKGHSVRSCLQRMAQGDHSLMLRYQNKYRSVIKSRPELVREIVDDLRAEGLDAYPPEVTHRQRTTLSEACRQLGEASRQQGDPEVVRACEVLTRLMLEPRFESSRDKSGLNVRLDLYRMALDEKQRALDGLTAATHPLLAALKEFLGQSLGSRSDQLPALCSALSEHVGALEQALDSVS